MPQFKEGLYDLIVDQKLIEQADTEGFKYLVEHLSAETSAQRLTDMIGAELAKLVGSLSPNEPPAQRIVEQAQFLNQLMVHVRERAQQQPATEILHQPKVLRALFKGPNAPDLPHVGLAQPWLFTAGKDSPGLLNELLAELRSCDAVDILMSFITMSGIRRILDILKDITAQDAARASKTKIRVITTTYIGATEQQALDILARLPNTEVKVSLDGRRTRLHAKAWIFERSTGFGSAYVGSANLTGAALMGGLEWTVKFTEKGQRNLYQRARAHFETLWQDGEFQSYDPENTIHRNELAQAIKSQKHGDSAQGLIVSPTFFDITPKPFQVEILDQLEAERELGRYRNLLVAATGTGKTVMAAFDYKRLCQQQGGQPRLLFVAHRTQILSQAVATYRQVLRDPNFGEILSGGNIPNSYNHLFATSQSLSIQQLVNKQGASFWNVVVIDECHHIEATQFSNFVAQIKPKYLLGLTATPERADGADIMRHFDSRPDGSPAAQLRLWTAIDLQLVAPFEYYGCDDGIDYRGVNWRNNNGQQDLDNILSANDFRAKTIAQAWQGLVSNIRECRALGFCVTINHAEFMARKFNEFGIPAAVVTGAMNLQDRATIINQLENYKINVVFTVDVFNEGVDIPFVETLLMLRPTQSATVFQQQIGRGLRLHPNKESCLILDFVGQFAEGFRFDRLYASITGLSRADVISGLEHGFGKLPAGCHIQLQKQARENVLNALQAIAHNWVSMQSELHHFAANNGHSAVSLKRFLTEQQFELESIYYGTNKGWSRLLAATDIAQIDDTQLRLSAGLTRLIHMDDLEQLERIRKVAEHGADYQVTESELQRLKPFTYQLAGNALNGGHEDILRLVAERPVFCAELKDFVELLEARCTHVYKSLPSMEWSGLKLHAAYAKAEILSAIGYYRTPGRGNHLEGVLSLPDRQTDLFFVTLDKSNALHEGVAYEDYAISQTLFHWQSQNATAPETTVGQRYINSPSTGWKFQLFVRLNNKSPYRACGPLSFVSSVGDRPMSITWKLESPLPMRLFNEFSVIRGG